MKDAQALLVKYEAAKKNCEDLRSRKEQVKNEKASIEESINKLNSIIESCETILEKRMSSGRSQKSIQLQRMK